MSPLEKAHRFRQNADLQKLFEDMEKDGFIPVCRVATVNGSHGTSYPCAQRILKMGAINPTALGHVFPGGDDFLGEGQYFWEDSQDSGGKSGLEAALEWGGKRYPTVAPAAVVAVLEFKKLFDLVSEKNRIFAQEFKKRLREAANSPENRGDFDYWEDWKFVKLLVLSCPRLAYLDIDGVRWNGFGLPKAARLRQTGLCVKNASCIKDLRIVV